MDFDIKKPPVSTPLPNGNGGETKGRAAKKIRSRVSNGCPNATHRRPTFPIEIPILLYRVAKGEWKIKKVVDESAVTRRIYNPIKYRPRIVRAPYPGPMEE